MVGGVNDRGVEASRAGGANEEAVFGDKALQTVSESLCINGHFGTVVVSSWRASKSPG